MFEVALRATVILALAWVAARSLRHATAATRHLVWHVALIAVLAAPVLVPLVPSWSLPLPVSALEAPAVIVDSLAATVPQRARVTAAAATGAPDRVITQSMPWTLAEWAGLAWLGGSLLVAAWFALGWIGATLTSRRAAAAPAQWHVELNALRQCMHVRREVRLGIVSRNSSPLAVGIWRASVLLPETAAAWSADRRRTVFVHELAHIKRADCRIHAFAQAACALHWFNPLAWVAFANLRAEREHACDDEVLRLGAVPSAYAAHLLEIAREIQAPLRPSAALAMARPSELEGRLLAVLASRRPPAPSGLTSWTVASALTVMTAAVLSASPALPSPSARVEPLASNRPVPTFISPLDGLTPEARLKARDARSAASKTLATSSDPQARERAITALAGSAGPDTIGPLEAALDDRSQAVREKAALGLGLISAPEVIPALLKALGDADSQVREKAAIGLALRRDPRVFDALVAAMKDPDSQVREKVAIALGTSGDSRAASPLQDALQDPDAQVREKAQAGLTLLQGASPDEFQAIRLRAGLRGLLAAFAAIPQ